VERQRDSADTARKALLTRVKTLGFEVDSARAKQRDNERAYKKKVLDDSQVICATLNSSAVEVLLALTCTLFLTSLLGWPTLGMASTCALLSVFVTPSPPAPTGSRGSGNGRNPSPACAAFLHVADYGGVYLFIFIYGVQVLRDVHFDCVIINEAAQCIEPDMLIPLQHACPKLVLFGDHKQLPATVLSTDAEKAGLGRSAQSLPRLLFKLLFNPALRSGSSII